MIALGTVLWSDDRKQNVADICELLRSGDASPEFLKELADMLDPSTTAKWRLAMSRRFPGRPARKAFEQHAGIVEAAGQPAQLKKQVEVEVAKATGVKLRQARNKLRAAEKLEEEIRQAGIEEPQDMAINSGN